MIPTPIARAGRVLALALVAGACASERTPAPVGQDGWEPCPGLDGRTVRWIVPFTAGGGYDVYSRMVEPFYERALGAEIVVENRPGANGWVASRLIRDAVPDGRTIGILQGTDLFIDAMMGEAEDLHPFDDFTPIGRIAVAAPVVLVSGSAPYGSWEAVEGADGPLVWGLGGVGGSSWIMYLVFTELLDVRARPLSGYPGAREVQMATIRGESDISAHTFESARDRVLAGDMVPIAQLTSHPGDYEELRGVPVVSGPDGLAARRAREAGRDPAAAVALVEALARVFDVGRLVVAPPGMDPALARCMRERFAAVVADTAFAGIAARAHRTLSYGEPEAIRAGLEASAAERGRLAALIRRSIEATRRTDGGA